LDGLVAVISITARAINSDASTASMPPAISTAMMSLAAVTSQSASVASAGGKAFRRAQIVSPVVNSVAAASVHSKQVEPHSAHCVPSMLRHRQIYAYAASAFERLRISRSAAPSHCQ
jgi:hypothetical protein